MIAWLLISFFVLLFLGVPIAMSLGLSAMGGILFLGGGSTVTIAQRMFEGMNSFALLAIPLYTFAGFTMSKGGIYHSLRDQRHCSLRLWLRLRHSKKLSEKHNEVTIFETSNFSCLHRCTFLQCVSGSGLHSKNLSARPSAN